MFMIVKFMIINDTLFCSRARSIHFKSAERYKHILSNNKPQKETMMIVIKALFALQYNHDNKKEEDIYTQTQTDSLI